MGEMFRCNQDGCHAIGRLERKEDQAPVISIVTPGDCLKLQRSEITDALRCPALADVAKDLGKTKPK